MRKILLVGATALSTFALSLSAHAQTASSSTQVEEVQVTARTLEDTLPEQLAQTGVKVEVIPKQAILNGGYPDVATALQALAPGLYIQPKNGPFDYVNISLLGSRTQDVLWMVDGVRINNRLYATTTPLDTMPAGIVDRLEVINGGQSLFYGTQAVAGAINIVTRPFSKTLDGRVSLSLDTNLARHLDFNVGNQLPVGQFVLYGSADKSEGYQSFRDQDYQPSASHPDRGYEVYTVGGKYAYDFTDQLRFEGSYQHTNADLDFALPYLIAHNINSRREDLATAKIDYQVNDRLAFFVKGYWHNWHTLYNTSVNVPGVPGLVVPVYQDAFWGYSDTGVNALGKLDITKGVEAYFGYDFQTYGGRDEVLFIKQTNETTHAAFGQIRLTPDLVPGLNLAAGFRYNAPSVGQSATIWNVSGKYEMPSGFYVKGEAGTNFRLPTAEELFADDPFDERGNPNLKPERTTSGNLTLGYKFDIGGHRGHVEATGFARDITDLIDLDTFDETTNQDVFGNVPGTVRVRGGQFLGDLAVMDSVSANHNYTYSKSTADGGAQITDVPVHLVKAGLDYHPATLPIGATLAVIYTGDIYAPYLDTQVNYGNYTVVDLSGRYFLDSGRHQQLNLSIRNLFDVQYGKPNRGCIDNPRVGPTLSCSPSFSYRYVNLGLPRTFAVSYTYNF